MGKARGYLHLFEWRMSCLAHHVGGMCVCQGLGMCLANVLCSTQRERGIDVCHGLGVGWMSVL